MVTEGEKIPSTWRKTFIALWFGCFMTGLGASMTMPFLPLFISSIGNFSRWQLNIYSGIAFAGTFLTQALISPYWGSLADRKGRKLMCLRASGVMAITIFLTGMAVNVWMIIALRLTQGLFSGYINNATAFIAGETPRSKSGSVMTMIMTAGVTGNLLGPLFGGALADTFGYRIPFYITGVCMALAFLMTLFNTTEHFKPISKKEMQPMRQMFADLEKPGLIIIMFLTTLIVQSSLMSISPIISLLVKELMHNHGNVSFVSGIVAATPGFGTLLVASWLGHKMDAVGPLKVLMVGLLAATLLFIPMFMTDSPWLLAFWRFLLGVANAALLPAVQTALTINVPAKSFGRIFSYNQSFQAAGGVIGPLMGSLVSSALDYQYVFLVTASLVFVNLLLVAGAKFQQIKTK
ncbi:MFS transporter [Ligilactobacillus agilis]